MNGDAEQKIDWNEWLDSPGVLHQIDVFSDETVDYRKDLILGFPTTTPHDINVTIAERYLLQQPNAIGLHTKRNSAVLSERGFSGIQQAEREVVYMIADILGALPNEIDGYICTGATEGNIVGLWIARNQFGIKHTAIVASPLSHYSLQKALNLLDFPKENLRLIGSDENGHLSIEDLRAVLTQSVERDIRNIILFVNAGTTMLGSVDDVAAINELMEEYALKYGVRVYIHVDAAFGGMIAPFLDHVPDIGFINKHVMSVAVDLHKMGRAPFGSGVVLARKGLFKNIETHAPYFPGNDHTLSGSRPGIIALQCWATMRAIGKKGFKKRAEGLFELANNIRNFLEERHFLCFKNDLNIVAVKGEPPNLIKEKYITHIQYNFPANLHETHVSNVDTVWNIVAIDHTKLFIEDFFDDIGKES